MTIDLERYQAAIQYGTHFYRVLLGENKKALSEYPDTNDENILQYIFDSLDSEKLYNKYLYNNIQSVLDAWLIEEIPTSLAKKQLIDILADHYDFGC